MTGEKSVRDENRERTELGFLYTQTLTDNQKTNQSGVRVKRFTNEGFEVTGHGHFVETPFDGLTVVDDVLKEEVDINIGERGPIIITSEQNQTGNVTWSITASYSLSGTQFLLASFPAEVPGTDRVLTLTDPWKFIKITAKSDTAFQAAGFVVKVQEQT